MPSAETIWVVFGFLAQACFMSRFLVQWIASERKGRSIIPIQFWMLSLLGSSMLLAYAIYKVDPVFIAGQAFGSVVYIRNLMLLRKHRNADTTTD
jgi:lipid-A-disaccharide synthase-like uncharacterized protein